ncbi:MAG: hypothetical protein GX654_00700 [Desulfatiglans sp.]|jgi:hypothetical protein|nr:hypothetical protein [Desulfatiglans sp.]
MAGNLISNVINPEIGRVGGLPETAFLAKSEYTMAKRPGSLDNKTVYLVDTGFGGSARFMIQLQQWFTKNMPKVKTVRRRKPGTPFMGSAPELYKEISEKGDAAILGVAG